MVECLPCQETAGSCGGWRRESKGKRTEKRDWRGGLGCVGLDGQNEDLVFHPIPGGNPMGGFE